MPQRLYPQEKVLFPRFERFFYNCRAYYASSLRWTLLHRAWIVILSLIIILLTGILFNVVGKGFIPSEDTGLVTGDTQVPVGTHDERRLHLERCVRADRISY